MNIKLIDTFCTGIVHTQFNASLLAMLSLQYKKINYYASKSNKRNVYDLVQNKYTYNNCIDYNSIFVWEGNSGLDLLIRYIISFLQIFRFLITSHKNDFIIFNYNNPLSLVVVNFINKILNRKILIFCHGEMETLLPYMDKGGLLHKLIRFCVRNFFLKKRKMNKNIHFCVLGESVLENIKKFIPYDNCQYFHCIDHPYIYRYKKRGIINDEGVGYTIGIVGVFHPKKGSLDFIAIAKKLKECNSNNIKLSITGRIYGNIDELQRLGIDLPKNKGEDNVSPSEFSERIQNLNYILLLYPIDSYKLIASGAIMDAIDNECPIIALRNQYFDYMFHKFGNFGYLFDDVESIYQFINKKNAFQDANFDFISLKQLTSPECIVRQLNEIINDIV